MMKILFLVAFAFLACGIAPIQAASQDVANGLGLFFEHPDDIDWQAVDEHGRHPATNIAGPFSGPASMYLVLINADVANVSGYQCGILRSDAGFMVLSATGDYPGWTNVGNFTNHIVTMDLPGKPVDTSGTVLLCTMVFWYGGTDPVEISLGPSVPQGMSDWNGPVIVGPATGDRRRAFLTSGISGEGFQVVATINGGGITAAEERSWARIKNLFR